MRIAVIALSTVSALAAMTISAFAADLYVPVDEPYIPTAAVESWSGAYVGVHAGYGWGEVFEYVGYGWELDNFIAGVQAGYNHQMDGVVLGVEADIAWTGLEGPYLMEGEISDPYYVASVKWMSTLRLRAGVDLDGVLLYATAGLAAADLQLDNTLAVGVDSTEVHFGYAVGVGVEKMVTDDISLKAEYLYSDFGAVDHYDSPDYPISFNVHAFKAGVNFHF